MVKRPTMSASNSVRLHGGVANASIFSVLGFEWAAILASLVDQNGSCKTMLMALQISACMQSC